MSEPIEDARHLSNRTTPTWEVELLISGVAVFAMLQLPGQLDDALLALEPRLDGNWRQLAILTYIYAKSAATILAITFVLHLLLRARWIALSGMHSVYPDGIRWDKLKSGPVMQRIEMARAQPLPETIERADNRASVIFAIGVMMAQMMVAIAVVAAAAFVIALLLYSATGLMGVPGWLTVIFTVVMLPYIAALLVDQKYGARMHEGGRGQRLLHRILDAYARIGFSRGSNPVMTVLASQDGDRKTMLMTTGVMLLSLCSVVLSLVMLASPEQLGSYGMFPRADALATDVDGAHYDDQRDPLRDGARPYIQSAVVTAPYLRLMVPYQPRRDEAAMRASCPHADALPKPAQATARLACLAALHPVALDGAPLEHLRYDAGSDARTDRPALVAMIDLRGLPPGRHELRVGRPLRSDMPQKKDNPDPGYDAIPFWR
jgi:hypothetical protein